MKTVCISGAGSGIGLATSIKLSQLDYQIILVGRNEDKLLKTQEQLVSPEKHIICSVDICKPDEMKATFEEKLHSIQLDAIIANAGIAGGNKYGKYDRWDQIIQTNLTGSYNFVNELLPYIHKRGKDTYRHIILISSILARVGLPQTSAYCASKAGLLGLARSWAVEMAPEKILVNTICPSWVNTNMAKEAIENYAKMMQKPYEEAKKIMLSQSLLGKMSEPSEVAELISFILSNHQTSFTGQVFDINNGDFLP